MMKRLLIIIFGILALVNINAYAVMSVSDINAAVKQLKGKLPIQVNEHLVLEDIVTKPTATSCNVLYKYKVLTDVKRVGVQYMPELMSGLTDKMRKDICTSPHIKPLIESNVEFISSYYDIKGVYIGNVVANQKTCRRYYCIRM